jgi:drug/metabolite transporter (DMT)-like permease
MCQEQSDFRKLRDANRSMNNAKWVGILCLGVTVVGWALNWPAMKVLLREWPPLFARGVAGLAAALILALVAVGRRETLHVPRDAIPRLLFASFTNVFAWMGFATVAMKWVSVSEGALLVYTMPIWAVLLAWPLLGTRPTLRDIAALLLGVLGVGMLLGGQGLRFSPEQIFGFILALTSAISFALGTVLNRSPLPIPPTALVAWQVGIGCLAMLVIGLPLERPDFGALSAAGWAVLVYMTLVPMGLCYLMWFESLRRLPSSVASMGTLLVPLIGAISAALTLGEPLGGREAIAIALTLSGVTLALQKT